MKKAIIIALCFALYLFLPSTVRAAEVSCGGIMFSGDTCSCASGANAVQGGMCCGYVYNGVCNPSKQIVACGGSYSGSESLYKTCSTSCGSEGDYTNSSGFMLHCCGYAYNGTCHTTPQPKQTVACGGSYDLADSAVKSCNTSCGHEEDFTDTNGNFMRCCGWTFDGVCGTKQSFACGQSYENDRTDAQCSTGCPSAQFSDITDGGKGKICCGYVTNSTCYAIPTAINVTCGKQYPTQDASKYACACNGVVPFSMTTGQTCCGYRPTGGGTNGCYSTAQALPDENGGNGTGGVGLSASTLDNLNASIFGGAPDEQLTTPRGIISKLLPYLFTLGGLILFVMLIWGGFEMLTGAANPKSQEAGKQRMTAAIIGFFLLFSSYWLAQLVQTIFGITIL